MDQQLFDAINRYAMRHEAVDGLFKVVSSYSVAVMLIIMLSFWFVKKKRPYAFFITLAIAASFGINRVLKTIIDRPRPFMDGDVSLVIERVPSSPSFPSDQALLAGVFVGFIWLLTKHWIRYVVLVFALLVLVSRVYVGHHYPLDVLVGFTFGMFLTYVFFQLFKRIKRKRAINT